MSTAGALGASGSGAIGPGALAIRPEVLQRIRSLEVRTRGLVESLFSGDHPSVFHGRGFEFSFVRPYQPGDDVRSIDWKVTARRNTPYVRQFVEERDLLVVLVVDVSASGRMGAGEHSAGEVAAEVAAAIAFAAARQNDRFALVLVSDEVEHVLPPGSGRKHAIRLLADLLEHEPRSAGTDLTPALDWVRRSLHRRATLFLVSDFIHPTGEAGFQGAVNRTARHHDLVGVRVGSPASDRLPDVGWIELTDPETGTRTVVNTGNPRIRERFRAEVRASRAEMADRLTRAGAELVDVDTATDPLLALGGFFHRRARR
ncbi:MAG: DUF58 domain-containing protein [Longimicrobiales bacterium]